MRAVALVILIAGAVVTALCILWWQDRATVAAPADEHREVQALSQRLQESLEQRTTCQRQMTKALWSMWREHGIAAGSQLKLDIYFDAPNRESAEALVAFLAEQHQLHAEVFECEDTPDSHSVWSKGNSKIVSLKSMLVLSEEMVEAGFKCGCYFDGFGAAIEPKEEGEPTHAAD